MDALMCKGHPNRRPERDLGEGARGQEALGDIPEAYQVPQLKMQPVSVATRQVPAGRGRGLSGILPARA